MVIINWLIYLVWTVILGTPINLFCQVTGIALPFWAVIAAKVVLGLILLYLLLSVVQTARRSIRKVLRGDGESLYDRADIAALAAQDQAQLLEAAGISESSTALTLANVEQAVEPLKKAKDYAAVAKTYATANRHKDAARWYVKAKMPREAALCLAAGGQAVKAAKLLMKNGEYEMAARLFHERGRHVQAAKAFEKAGKGSPAAEAYARARKYKEAAEAYSAYFADPHDDVAIQVHAAEQCLAMLNDPAAAKKIPDEVRRVLLPALAGRFEQADRHADAAPLFEQAGDPGRAGEVYLLAGELQEAARCMEKAGRGKEASNILGRFKEKQGKWDEAAMAYVQGGDVAHAGECYLKAGNVLRAAECFAKAGAYYRAGLAYARAGRFKDAIPPLQHVKEQDTNFDLARQLLGRCFYELHDYAHCAATLDNHLSGVRVASDNVDSFYMLALAYEQMGRLDKARELLYKIRTVDVGFRDVTQRISSIASRISLMQSQAASTPGAAQSGASIESVENTLGGRYQLQKELGRGGMGVVYLAKDTQLDRQVALKFLGTLVDDSEEFRERFVREARAAARINHPNIISIYDISASVGKAYIAMEYVEGPSLLHYIRQKGGLSPEETVNVMGQASAAMAAIHDAGIVHRDIKPDNILLAKGGLVKLMDFGLAKADDSRMTRTGVVMGTPCYMSPEQVKGKEADARSDIYSMGLVLYECLSGETTFRGDNVMERQLEEMPAPPSSVVQGVPPALDATIMKCIQKDPAQRYQHARELLAALRAVKAG